MEKFLAKRFSKIKKNSLVKKLKNDQNVPQSWKPAPRLPRTSAVAASPIYVGAAIEIKPTPSPVTTLPIISCTIEEVQVIIINQPIANIKKADKMDNFLPRISTNAPPISEPKA